MSTKYTVIGGNGFIGGEIVTLLKEKGEDVHVPVRNCESLYTQDLGIVIFAAGNGDCAQKPFEVFNSNTRLLADLLERAEFTKLIYISSTRVYMEQEASNEDSNVTICTNDKRRLFNLTKLLLKSFVYEVNETPLLSGQVMSMVQRFTVSCSCLQLHVMQ